MRTALLKQLDALDVELESLFDELEPYSYEQLNQQPAPDSWCATQILQHLLLSEMYSRQYCQKKLSFSPQLADAGLLDRVRTMLVSSYFSLPLKWEAPKAINTDALPRESQLADIRKNYREQRVQLREFLTTVDEQYLGKAVYKHPFAGRLSLAGMLRFFKAHFIHHRKQIKRALSTAHSATAA